jgi:hypothetical protein
MSASDHPVLRYLLKHLKLIAVLGSVGFGALGLGALWVSEGSVQQGLLFSFGTGVLGALVITFVADFMSKEFLYEVLRNFQTSVHQGGLIHSNHREIPSRPEAIRRSWAPGQTAKIATFTADNYLQDEAVLELIKQRLSQASSIRILLHTPIYNLRSYVDRVKGAQTLGKRHLSALELVRQQAALFPTIKALSAEFGDRFVVRLSTVQLHIHTAIWGSHRIYASLVLRGVDGQDSPCIEVFPGLKDSTLFRAFETDFDYVWDRPDLTFTVEEIVPFYRKLLARYPMEVDLGELDGEFIDSVGVEAAMLNRRKQSQPLPGPTMEGSAALPGGSALP